MGLFKLTQFCRDGTKVAYDNLPDTTAGNFKAAFYMYMIDHAILRTYWSNMVEIAPGVWRSNHPTFRRWKKLKKMGIKSILNLRAISNKPPYQTEARVCDRLGLKLLTASLSAGAAPEKEKILKLIEAFRTIEKPFLMHCKSGADRTGLASAIYLLAIENRPLDEARQMLSPKFLHLKFTKRGVLDAFLHEYEKVGGEFECWLRNVYDRDAMQASFNKAYNARSWWK